MFSFVVLLEVGIKENVYPMIGVLRFLFFNFFFWSSHQLVLSFFLTVFFFSRLYLYILKVDILFLRRRLVLQNQLLILGNRCRNLINLFHDLEWSKVRVDASVWHIMVWLLRCTSAVIGFLFLFILVQWATPIGSWNLDGIRRFFKVTWHIHMLSLITFSFIFCCENFALCGFWNRVAWLFWQLAITTTVT